MIDEMGWDELRAPELCHIRDTPVDGRSRPAACTA